MMDDYFSPKPMHGQRSPQWPALREAHLLKEPVCQACGRDHDLQVHHVKPVHVFPALELEPGNLITLCEPMGGGCHFFLGHYYSWRSWNKNIRRVAVVMRRKIRNRPGERQGTWTMVDVHGNLAEVPVTAPEYWDGKEHHGPE